MIPALAPPLEHVPAPPDLGPKLELGETGRLGDLAKRSGPHILPLLDPTTGRKPKRTPILPPLRPKQQHPIRFIHEQDPNGAPDPHILRHVNRARRS